MTHDQRSKIRQSVTGLVEQLASELSLDAQAVADVAFLHVQKHPAWGRNATKAQKRAAHEHWQGLCQGCNDTVVFGEAVFHHFRRRIPNQHGPDNLRPYHAGCHDSEHGVQQGSLSKGSPKRKAP